MSQPILPMNDVDRLLSKLRELEKRIEDLERAPRTVTAPAGG
jgi:hypothetical protein